MAETKLEPVQPSRFELIAGNVCLDFINTLDDRPSGEPKELLKDYDDLARFGEEAGILTPAQFDDLVEKARAMHDEAPDEAEEALRRARNLREALHDIFSALMNLEAAPQPAMNRLNANLHDAALHSRLTQRETIQRKPGCEWRFDDLTSSFNAMLWPIARAAADLLASSDLPLVRACSSPTCQWFFLDTSKNHRRRWCDMKSCGNRAKVRRFYAKQKTT
ncbi:MAG TPA: ABATE domain-containing protein [Candidatus Eremiobacteraceae bacterium]|nr:ABATE domain-containing protein [Candidatus Eremiobacteraceae bacterium]